MKPIEQLKVAGDVTSVGAAWGAVIGWLPYFAAFLTVIWTGFRLWEMLSGRPLSETAFARWVMSFFKRNGDGT